MPELEVSWDCTLKDQYTWSVSHNPQTIDFLLGDAWYASCFLMGREVKVTRLFLINGNKRRYGTYFIFKNNNTVNTECALITCIFTGEGTYPKCSMEEMTKDNTVFPNKNYV